MIFCAPILTVSARATASPLRTIRQHVDGGVACKQCCPGAVIRPSGREYLQRPALFGAEVIFLMQGSHRDMSPKRPHVDTVDDPGLADCPGMHRNFSAVWVNVRPQLPRALSFSNASRTRPTTKLRGALPPRLTLTALHRQCQARSCRGDRSEYARIKVDRCESRRLKRRRRFRPRATVRSGMECAYDPNIGR